MNSLLSGTHPHLYLDSGWDVNIVCSGWNVSIIFCYVLFLKLPGDSNTYIAKMANLTDKFPGVGGEYVIGTQR